MPLSASLLREKPWEKLGLLTLRSTSCTEHGVLETTTDKILIDFVTNTSTRTDTKALKKNYPSVYADVVSSSESRKLKFSVQTKAI